MAFSEVDNLAINVIRGLAIDAVEKAKSGHPGMPLGCAPMAYTLWSRHLKFDPDEPEWIDRDRFILSAGHGSMLLYSLLNLFGYDLQIEDLQNFRQLGSRTPGHPENTHTPGVEMATGPLGQGFATAVGMAVAEEYLAARYNRPDFAIFDHKTYVLASDGDLMEGISHEAASLAGHLKLGKLIVLYDDNNITIDGKADEAWGENIPMRFEAYGWHVQQIDGMDPDAVDKAIAAAATVSDRPSIICCKTIIGFGSPNKANTSGVHGSPLGAEELKLTKENLGLPVEEAFWVPQEVRDHCQSIADQSAKRHEAWIEKVEKYRSAHPGAFAELEGILSGECLESLNMPVFGREAIATRAANGRAINAVAEAHAGLIGGSADLTDNVQTRIKSAGLFRADDRTGRNIPYGVREHAMAACSNGITLHGGTRGFTGTFLVFSDYCRPSIRLAALIECPTIFCFSHDSIGLGEDGPTHQPIEQVMSLRAIPNLNVIRPADGNETSVAWSLAAQSESAPTAIVTTRQAVPALTPEFSEDHPAFEGGYILHEASNGTPRLILVATGSELQLAVGAREKLEERGVPTRVVSLPSWFIFERQSADYQEGVLPMDIPIISIEAGTTLGWDRHSHFQIGIDHFGASAPAPQLFEEFGFTVDSVVMTSLDVLEQMEE